MRKLVIKRCDVCGAKLRRKKFCCIPRSGDKNRFQWWLVCTNTVNWSSK